MWTPCKWYGRTDFCHAYVPLELNCSCTGGHSMRMRSPCPKSKPKDPSITPSLTTVLWVVCRGECKTNLHSHETGGQEHPWDRCSDTQGRCESPQRKPPPPHALKKPTSPNDPFVMMWYSCFQACMIYTLAYKRWYQTRPVCNVCLFSQRVVGFLSFNLDWSKVPPPLAGCQE